MNNKSVSAVASVILMVIIYIATASTVYLYVTTLGNNEKIYSTVDGNCTDFYFDTVNNIYVVTFDDGQTIFFFDNQGINWQIGTYYNLTIWTKDHFKGWWIEEYLIIGRI